MLLALHDADGAIVPFVDLLRVIDANRVSEQVAAMRAAPPEVKEAVSHINAAFRKVGCSLNVDNVRGRGYRLLSPDE